MITRPHTHLRRLLAGTLAIAAAAAVATPAQAGQTKTLRLFEKTTDVTLTSADGTPKQGAPAPGDILDASGDLYRGNHRHHGARRVGTDHTRCTFTAPDTATCATEVAIGGSLILVRSGADGERFTAWYGTGAFKGITGGGTSHNLGNSNNSDIVLRYRLG